jgi:aspartate/methionine/tyrosine aminotransferase
VRQRLAGNLSALDRAIAAQGADCPVRRVPSAGGWVCLVEVPRTRSDEQWAARLVDQAAVLVQPGYLFDIAEPGTMVVSLLPEPTVFEPAIERAVACWSAG